jgi:hypothetical protein
LKDFDRIHYRGYHLICNCYGKFVVYQGACLMSEDKNREIKYLDARNLLPLESARKCVSEDSTLTINNIAEKGFDETFPIIVINHKGNHYIHDGHRRSLGALAAGIEQVPAIVIDSNEILPNCGGVAAHREVESAYKPGYVYDWHEAVDYCRRQNGHSAIDWDKHHASMPVKSFDTIGRPGFNLG